LKKAWMRTEFEKYMQQFHPKVWEPHEEFVAVFTHYEQAAHVGCRVYGSVCAHQLVVPL
jgi:hypothetical protein